jgi:hypothetical protein
MSPKSLAGLELDDRGLGAVQSLLAAEDMDEPLARRILLAPERGKPECVSKRSE